LGQQGLGERFDVALRDGAEEEQLQQFVVGKAVQASGAGAFAQPLAVAAVQIGGRIRQGLSSPAGE
jgi:hypothetical protein